MPISVMLKPSSSACNLCCSYCFYSDLASHRSNYSNGFMSEKTADNVIKSAFEFAKGSKVLFTFQGGEPMLIGLDFYKRFVAAVKKYNTFNSSVEYCLQTNGTRIDSDWCAFFKENNFLLGVSLDGNRNQNTYRRYPDGRESFDDVMDGIRLLREYKVEFNVLSVITKALAQSVRDNYKFFKKNGIYNFQYINCLGSSAGDTAENYCMDSSDYALFLEKAFRLYYNDNMRGEKVSVRSFDNYLSLLNSGMAEQCGMNGFCSQQFVVEGDGSVYPCDFYCSDEWELGNINSISFSELEKSKKAKSFIEESFSLEDNCIGCDYFALCRGGGCKRGRNNAEFCKVYKKFFSSSLGMMRDLHRMV